MADDLPFPTELVAFAPEPIACDAPVPVAPAAAEVALTLEVAPAPLGGTDDVALIWERIVPLKDPDMFSKLDSQEQRAKIAGLCQIEER